MKVRANDLSNKQRIEALDMLYTAAGSVRGRDAMKVFLRDLLTESERIMMGRRLLIARAVLQGHGYEKIAQELGVGFDTVRRVDRWLEDQIPGYEDALKGVEKEKRRRSKQAYINDSGLKRLKKKYPLYFLLIPSSKGRTSNARKK